MGRPRNAPLHLPIAVGLTTGLYAVALAGVTALQSQTDGAIVAGQRPAADALAGLASSRGSLERDLTDTVSSLNRAAALYNGSIDQAAAFHATLTELARRVQSATGAAAHIPSRLQLPSAARPVTAAAAAPTVQATTGASGKP